MWECHYIVNPTEAGKKFLGNTQQGTMVLLGTRVPFEITGITSPSAAMGPTACTANFTYRIALTPFGQIANAGRPVANENQVFQGEADFVLYDDGWRVEQISFAQNDERL